MVVEISELNKFNDVLQKNKYVAVDFFATWCGPCKTLSPAFKEMSESEKWKNIYFCKVDSDVGQEISDQYSVQSLPTIIFFANGQAQYKVIGNNQQAIKSALDDLLKL